MTYKCDRCKKQFNEDLKEELGNIFMGTTKWWTFCHSCAQDIEASFINDLYLCTSKSTL